MKKLIVLYILYLMGFISLLNGCRTTNKIPPTGPNFNTPAPTENHPTTQPNSPTNPLPVENPNPTPKPPVPIESVPAPSSPPVPNPVSPINTTNPNVLPNPPNTISVPSASIISNSEVSLIFTGSAPHIDYYVAKMIIGASDSNDGRAPIKSGSHGPWLTVNKAARTVIAGDIVHVYTGVYAESVSIANNGSVSTPIRFYAAPDHRPTIQGFYLKDKHYLEISGFIIIGPKVLPSNWQEMPTIIVDDPSVGPINPSQDWTARQPLINRKYATYTNTVNAFYGPNYSAFEAGIWIRASDHIVVTSNTLSLHTIGIDADQGSSHLIISNNAAFHCMNGIWSIGSGYSDSVVSNNHCYQNLSSGINLGGCQRVKVIKNLCEYNGILQFAVSDNSSNCLLQYNIGQYGGFYTETMPFPGSSCFNFYKIGPGNVADGNYAAYQQDPTANDGNGFINDTSDYSVTFINNISYRNWGTGITFTLSKGNVAINNTCVENGYLTPGIPATSSLNNGAGIRYGSNCFGSTVVNNILANNRTCGLHGDGSLSNHKVDFNLYTTNSPAIHDSYNANSRVFKTAKDVATITSQEQHGLSADPRFVSITNFALQSTSPAIGRADPRLAPTTDFLGKSRDSSPDIGAVER